MPAGTFADRTTRSLERPRPTRIRLADGPPPPHVPTNMKRISASPIRPLAILGTRRGAPARAALAALGIAAIPCVFIGADRRPEPASAFARTPPSAAATTGRTATLDDADADGVLDARENQVAARFAPVVVHHPDENAFPTSVDEFLKRTTLWLYDDACSPDLVVRFGAVTQASLVKAFGPTCGTADWIDSYGVRSRRKQHTFFLSDVDPGHRGGASDRRDWPTYVHSYPTIGVGSRCSIGASMPTTIGFPITAATGRASMSCWMVATRSWKSP
jgi:hypothetical protein